MFSIGWFFDKTVQWALLQLAVGVYAPPLPPARAGSYPSRERSVLAQGALLRRAEFDADEDSRRGQSDAGLMLVTPLGRAAVIGQVIAASGLET